MRTAHSAIWIAALALVAAAPGTAPARPPDAVGSTGWEVVAQIERPGGTDLEFLSRAMKSYRNADGNTVTPPRAVTRHFAVVGNLEANTQIVDITNPEAPYVAAEIPCALYQGDIQVSAARSIVLISNGRSSSKECMYTDAADGVMKPMPPGSAVVDISDIYRPAVVAAAPANFGAHNHTLHPSGRYLYISTSNIGATNGAVPVYDLADIRRPKLVTTFTAPGNAPHDIRFNPSGTRAYLAGISQYRIIDTSDPTQPKLISTFYPPGTTIGHDTLVTRDGAYLFAGDEAGGGGFYPCPGGAIHVFDIRSEKNPVYLGQAYAGAGPVTTRDLDSPSDVGLPASCTAHVMELNPDGLSLTIGWYGAGTRVFRFDDLYDDGTKPAPGPVASYGRLGSGLVEAGWIRPNGASTWSAKQYAPLPGYIFSDDLSLGFYVTRLPKK